MKITAIYFRSSLLAVAISLAIASGAAANNSKLLSFTPPAGTSDTVTINDTVTLSLTENTQPAWDNFRSLRVGYDSDGTLLINNRHITTNAGMIGNAASGQVTLTHHASWTLTGLNLVLGTNNGSGKLLVNDGSRISGINEFRIGEHAAGADGEVIIDGADSAVSAGWSVVGDQGHGKLTISNGGSLSLSRHMSIGYVGVTELSNYQGYGDTRVTGENARLTVAKGIYLGGFATTTNDATGVLTVSNGATIETGDLIWLAVGKGATGILNIGGAQGESEQAAGALNAPRIHLGNTDGVSTAILNFNHSSEDFSLAAAITGTGEVNHIGSGVTTLTGASNYRGTTHVANGTLRAGKQNTLSANADYQVDNGAHLDLNGYSQTANTLTLAGTATLSADTPAQSAFAPATLTINGNYRGDNGLLAMRTVLDDDLSATDKLIVKGDTAGVTRVTVSNAGGSGAQTVEGIRIIDVVGASNGSFVKEGRIVAGAYDYDIAKRDNQNWYLTSVASAPSEQPETPVQPEEPAGYDEPITPVEPVTPTQPDEPDTPLPPVDEGVHQYRPEAGSYLANTLAANTLFTTRLHDRLGETQYTDLLTGEKKVTSLWLRNVGGHTRFKDGSGQISTQSNRYVVQLGGDVAQWSTDGRDRWHLGLMAGYANAKSRSHASLTGYTSRGEISGYSTGVYGTWYANDADKSGAYVDAWMLYNWFDNTVSGQGLRAEKYDADGITASLETGYTWKLANLSERNALYIQPKAQLTWMDVQADNHTEKNGTRVVNDTRGNLQTRLGVKAYLQGHHAMDDGKNRTFQPFVEANWLYNSQTYRVKMDDIRDEVKGTRNIGELKAGVEGQLTPRLQLWGNVAQQTGDQGYSDTQGMLGLKYMF